MFTWYFLYIFYIFIPFFVHFLTFMIILQHKERQVFTCPSLHFDMRLNLLSHSVYHPSFMIFYALTEDIFLWLPDRPVYAVPACLHQAQLWPDAPVKG